MMAGTPLFTVLPRRAPWPSPVDRPPSVVILAFLPSHRVLRLLISTTPVPVPVYVPMATLMVSPFVAFVIAPLMVSQGEPTVEHEFESFPVVATYQIAPASATTSSDDNSRVVTWVGGSELVGIGVTVSDGMG